MSGLSFSNAAKQEISQLPRDSVLLREVKRQLEEAVSDPNAHPVGSLEPEGAAGMSTRITAADLKRAKEGTEAQFTKLVIDFAQLHGWRVAHFRAARVLGKDGVAGWRTAVSGDGVGFPDLILARGERLLVAELKVGRNTTSQEQQQWLAAFDLAGISAFTWRPADWQQIEALLK